MPKWYQSLYWRIAIGFLLCLALLLVVQAMLFVWLVARSTRPAITAHALKKRPAFVDTSSHGAVRLGSAAWIREECSVGDKADLRAAGRAHGHQHCHSKKNPGYERAFILVPSGRSK